MGAGSCRGLLEGPDPQACHWWRISMALRTFRALALKLLVSLLTLAALFVRHSGRHAVYAQQADLFAITRRYPNFSMEQRMPCCERARRNCTRPKRVPPRLPYSAAERRLGSSACATDGCGQSTAWPRWSRSASAGSCRRAAVGARRPAAAGPPARLRQARTR